MKTSYDTTSKVEEFFLRNDRTVKYDGLLRRIPAITVDNYVELGQLTALRFLEWVCLNPGGVIALPTGKTPEFFIKWVEYYLQNWDKELSNGMLLKTGFKRGMKPDMKSLHFFQLDEFFPMNPSHERSFTYFVKKFYIEPFGLDPEKVNLIDTYHLTSTKDKILDNFSNVEEIFKNDVVDLGIRIKKPCYEEDIIKKAVIQYYDQFCGDYEKKIRDLGGIGFFLGGIGPDGHIAFNVRGSGHYSTTRLTSINYETQAAAASDLGGIELVKKKAVITIGLETIRYNPDCVAIIIAAGESKAQNVANAVESEPSIEYPASSLQKLSYSRFYITKSASKRLEKTSDTLAYIYKNDKDNSLIEQLVYENTIKRDLSLMEVSKNHQEHENEADWKLLKKLTGQSLSRIIEETHKKLSSKIYHGLKIPDNQIFLHTAPHHDDIELAYFPYLHHLVRYKNNENFFCYCTSGFTSVTTAYVMEHLNIINKILNDETEKYNTFKEDLKDINLATNDITGYLNGIASQNKEEQARFVSRRLIRLFYDYLGTKDEERMKSFVEELLSLFSHLEPGRQEPEIAHLIKGWLREFEAELVWAHFGIDIEHVHHLRLHFYTDDIFPEYPDYDMDVLPILNLLVKTKPTIITLALDPEGSGPDTHYKTLIAIGDAIDKYVEQFPERNIRIWGYRNVWSRFHPSEANMLIPVSLNSFAVLHNMFNSCFLSQRSASFPSYELDGTFSELAQKIWVQQHDILIKLLGKSYFYDSPNPLLRRSYGAIFLKDMSYNEFKVYMKPVRRLLQAKEALKSE